MRELISLHDHIFLIIVLIIFFIFYVLCFLIFNNFFFKSLSEGSLVEAIWSVIPAGLLIVLVVPSIGTLYAIEDFSTPSLSVKVVAHQWYWSYTIPQYYNICYIYKDFLYFNYSFDSFMLPNPNNTPRLLSSSEDLVLPALSTTRFLVSSADVLHSFALPSLGVKVDAVPGRINQLLTTPYRLGSFFGQCSEICGANHSFIPITIKVVPSFDFFSASHKRLFGRILDDSD